MKKQQFIDMQELGISSIPNLLLTHYRQLGLNETETFLGVEPLHFSGSHGEPYSEIDGCHNAVSSQSRPWIQLLLAA